MMPRPRTLVPPLALAGVLLLAGCNLFAPRTPEAPTQSGVRVDYSEPESTLSTMARGIEAKAGSNGSSAYIGALADGGAGDAPDFSATYDPAAVAIWQSVSGHPPSAWNRAREEQLYGYIAVISGNPYTFYWLTDVDNPHDEDLALNVKLLHRQYLLVDIPEGSGSADTLAIGYADLTMTITPSVGKWVVWKWQDRVDLTVGANPNKGKLSMSALRLGRL